MLFHVITVVYEGRAPPLAEALNQLPKENCGGCTFLVKYITHLADVTSIPQLRSIQKLRGHIRGLMEWPLYLISPI